MRKDLKLQSGVRPAADLRDLIQRKLTGEDDAFRAEVEPGAGGIVVRDRDLGGNVALAARSVTLRKAERPEVSKDQGVHAAVVEQLQMGG